MKLFKAFALIGALLGSSITSGSEHTAGLATGNHIVFTNTSFLLPLTTSIFGLHEGIKQGVIASIAFKDALMPLLAGNTSKEAKNNAWSHFKTGLTHGTISAIILTIGLLYGKYALTEMSKSMTILPLDNIH